MNDITLTVYYEPRLRGDVYGLHPRGVSALVTDGERRDAPHPTDPAVLAVARLLFHSMPVHDEPRNV